MTHSRLMGNDGTPWNAKRAALAVSFRRIPTRSWRSMTCQSRDPIRTMVVCGERSEASTTEVTGSSSRVIGTPGATSILTTSPFRKKLPARGGTLAPGKTTGLAGSDPKELSPSSSQKRPVTESQPSGSRNSASRRACQASTSARWASGSGRGRSSGAQARAAERQTAVVTLAAACATLMGSGCRPRWARAGAGRDQGIMG